MDDTPAIAALLRAVESTPPGRILVAVSGGPDSVALLRALHAARRDIAVAHVNHGLRGAESDADEAFVRALAADLGVPALVTPVDMSAAGAGRGSLEASARRLRYSALAALLADWGGDYVATAHTQNDQAETVLLNLVRGSGLAGLGGMNPDGTTPLRPFLSVPRTTILQALDDWHQPYRVDSSNLSSRFTRNRLRAQAIPFLEQINPRAVDALARTARLLAEDSDFIEMEADRAITALVTRVKPRSVTMSRAGWASLHPALASAVARRLIQMLLGDVVDIDERHIAAIVAAVRTNETVSTNLPRHLHLDLSPFLATLHAGPPAESVPLPPATLEIPGSVDLVAGTLSATRDDVATGELDRLLAVAGRFHALCDADAVGDRLLIRSRRSGDRIKPNGGTGTRKVQDVMVDARVPRANRDRIPVVCNDRLIVWIPGLALDRRVAASPNTAHILHLVWRPNRWI